ncbi:hypothetical protein EJ04DRAFT_159952 [Polyplosphaeria fusca]|uniref:Uncharacterized protein n=1 Tax=Polyplosphaeria fusca TaxID=682080 RepID=A0A9P4QYZ0_9PLEO|nr:hypothetical protein EJ04DRAFT_159952 [Polyplosphaeria fusca]
MQLSSILYIFALGAAAVFASPSARNEIRQNCLDCELRVVDAGFCLNDDPCCWKDHVFREENQDVCGGCPIQREVSEQCP